MSGINVPEINERVGCKLLAKLQFSVDRRNVWNMETTTVTQQLNVVWINVLSWSGRLTAANTSSQFLGNYHPDCKLILEYGRSFVCSAHMIHPTWPKQDGISAHFFIVLWLI